MAHNDLYIWIKYFNETNLPLLMILSSLFSRLTAPSFSQKRSQRQQQKQNLVALTRTPELNKISSPWLTKILSFVFAQRFVLGHMWILLETYVM